MRTTIDLDEELLRTAKAISEVRKQTLSRVISDLAWRGLTPNRNEGGTRNGFPVLAALPGSQPVTPEHVATLLDEADTDSGSM